MITIEKSQEQSDQTEEVHQNLFPLPIIGHLSGTGKSGEILVECNNAGPRPARLTSSVLRTELTKPENIGREVLLVFEEGDLNRPIIIGMMEDPFDHLVTMEVSTPPIPPPQIERSMSMPLTKDNENSPPFFKGGRGGVFSGEMLGDDALSAPPPLTGWGQGEGVSLAQPHSPKEALIDGKRVTIEASEEIVLKCGNGSITIRKDGKIIIIGTHLLSRSSGPIRVKGARVDIN